MKRHFIFWWILGVAGFASMVGAVGGVAKGSLQPHPATMKIKPAPAPLPAMPTAQDQVFVMLAGESNLAAITFSRLALDRGRNPQVRAIAGAVLRDRRRGQRWLQAIARQKDLPTSPVLSAGHALSYEALKRAQSDDFDTRYLVVQVKDDENSLKLFQQQATEGTDPRLRGFARTYLPHIITHAAQVYRLAYRVSAPGMEVLPPTMPRTDGMQEMRYCAGPRSTEMGG